MNFFGGNARQKAFERQVLSLQNYLPVAVHRDHERRHWEVGIQLPGPEGRVLVCQLLLDSEFPDSPPIVQLTTPCDHPLVGEDGMQVIGHEKLRNWHSHFDVGQLASEIIHNLTQIPPRPRPARQPQQRHPQPQHQPHQPHPQQVPAHHPRVHATPVPDHQPLPTPGPSDSELGIPPSFPALNEATEEGLQQMLVNTGEAQVGRKLFIEVRPFF